MTTALSPDGSTLLILTSSSNDSFDKDDGTPMLWDVLGPTTGQPTRQTTSNAEWVFVYELTGPVPVQKQKLNLPVTYNGLIWDKSGTRFYVSGGADDMVYPFKKVGSQFQLDAPFMVLNTGGNSTTLPPGPRCRALDWRPPHCQQASIPRTSPLKSLHDGAWWANATRNFNFKHPDELDAAAFNRVLWRGMMGEEKPYPVDRGKNAVVY